MGLYSSFNPSDYYDDKDKKSTTVTTQSIHTPDRVQPPSIPTAKKRSLYEQAKEVATSPDMYKGPDFRKVYRVGQQVAIQAPNGNMRTTKGVIAEIVAENLMYVYMTDTYKDANDQWLVDFVTDKDKIHLL